MVSIFNCLENCGFNVSILETEGSNGSLFRYMKFQCFPVQELKVPKAPYFEMGGSNVFCLEIGRASCRERV